MSIDEILKIKREQLFPILPLNREVELEIIKRIVNIEKKLDLILNKIEELEKEIKKK